MPRESKRARRERTSAIIARLEVLYPDTKCSLDYADPLQLLVATVLSAQCTDAAVNRATPALFARFRNAADFGAASRAEMEDHLKSLNFFRNKSKSLIGLGQALTERHGGEVPVDLDALTALPGVGRKTANVLLGVGFGIAEGVVVDTHVKRLTHRWGITRETDPERIEQDLIPLVPPEKRVEFTHRAIDHGRAVCTARRAFCELCVLADLCPTAPAVYRQRSGNPVLAEAGTTATDPGGLKPAAGAAEAR
ncbi:MAG TPA: endonuclease III [Longimicrobium sp.]|nr:endonuclease III [Longimicrobium sp.]